MRAQSGLLLETGIYFNAPNHPHTPHIHQGQPAGSAYDSQPQEPQMHFMWTFVDKCSIICLTGVVVVVVVVCVFTVCVRVCLQQTRSEGPRQNCAMNLQKGRKISIFESVLSRGLSCSRTAFPS